MSKILIIEDDAGIRRGLGDALRVAGYTVTSQSDGFGGLKAAIDQRPDLLVLDLMLPGLSGYEICRQLRSDGNQVPIIMLTARAEEMDRVLGLNLGADDYLTKPFSMPELIARVQAVLRRTRPDSAAPVSLSFGNVVVDFLRFEAQKAGNTVPLSRKEFGMLRSLATRDGIVVRREELLDEVWGEDEYPSTRTIDNHVASLRSKLEDDPGSPRHLLTMHGVGYRLVRDP